MTRVPPVGSIPGCDQDHVSRALCGLVRVRVRVRVMVMVRVGVRVRVRIR